MKSHLKGKHILLGVTGSIAAYKACIVLRMLQRAGADVRVIMTDSALHFIGRLTFEALTQNEVITDLFPANRMMKTEHVHLAEWADLLLICPATANCVGKVAAGIADDFLTTLIMTTRSPVIFAPAMDSQMVKNPIYRNNCIKLRKMKYHILETESGVLASGLEGPGRLIDPKIIMDHVLKILSVPTRISGKKILISAGPTREYIDAVRFISNPSSGKMGIALAEEAYLRGADVRLVTGPIHESIMHGISIDHVENTLQLEEAIIKYWKDRDILIMAAAVADYRAKHTFSGKYKKRENQWSIELTKTNDILKSAGKTKGNKLMIGFAVESENGIANASQKLHDKHLDLICLNEIDKVTKTPFGSNINKVTIIDRNQNIQELPCMEKSDLAVHIWDKIESLLDIV